MSSEVKQVIVIRKDLKMRRGKEIAQGAHASMGALLSLFKNILIRDEWDDSNDIDIYGIDHRDYPEPVKKWLEGSFTKICVTVDSEEELLKLEQISKEIGIPHALIEDNGLTEFGGVKTKTALGIGPWWSNVINNVTGHLKLY